jgi:nicotinate-nucleotide pyrophosphorylase
MSDANKSNWPKWVRDDKSVVSCTEKVKVMTENFDELKQMAQDALEDGLLMEVSEAQMREALHVLVDSLINPYPNTDSN